MPAFRVRDNRALVRLSFCEGFKPSGIFSMRKMVISPCAPMHSRFMVVFLSSATWGDLKFRLRVSDAPSLRSDGRINRRLSMSETRGTPSTIRPLRGHTALRNRPGSRRPGNVNSISSPISGLSCLLTVLDLRTDSMRGQPTIAAPAARCSAFCALTISAGSTVLRFSIQCAGTRTPCHAWMANRRDTQAQARFRCVAVLIVAD